jgi:hypothetical protein
MAEPWFIDVFVEPNPNAPEGSGQRWKATSPARLVRRARWEGRWCAVVGLDSDGTAGDAFGATVEDSGAGTAVLVYGGAWGVRLIPEDGGDPFGEAYLLLDPAAVEPG